MTPPIRGPVSPLATSRLAVRPLGLDQVELTGGFWARWQRQNREVTTPHALSWLERDGSVANLRSLAKVGSSVPHQGMWFSDSDVHKVLEALSWDLGRAPSAYLSGSVSELAEVLRAAQQEDGYLNSYVQAGHDVRWDNLVMSHELYCIGHLIQAGVAHARATGTDELLDIARRAADCVVRDFAELRRKDTDGHPVIEMALVELYRQTGSRPYLELAQQLIDVRGHRVLDPKGHFDSTYYQDAVPVREQSTVVGHAVRALYLLCGVVDVYTETGERALLDSALRQWESLLATKMYLNGAVGSRFDGESFGDEYELPPDLVYGETCATIASVMLSWRLLLATGQSRFADHIERALHNLFAASTSVERDAFFYNNPAQRRTARPAAPTQTRPQRAEAPGTRPHWFQCACCPPNIMRTVASLGGYVATCADDGIQIHQYLPAVINAPAGSLTMATDYPLDGTVELTVTSSTSDTPWTLALRIPDWCRGATVTVNGDAASASPGERGYLELARPWQEGDRITLTLPMPPRLTTPHPAVDALRGTVAIERGPVVYCLESPDQADGVDLNHVEILVDEPLAEEPRPDLLGQPVIVVTAAGFARDDSAWAGSGWATLGEQPPPTGRPVRLTAIPYHLWANRGPSVMRIFIPTRHT
ncbi:MAG TPA: beta-L-arabinofuranosidase domain-containing protein [Actinophytocola sp.]|uniref:glycoside hydrolase family 127 protein n=1 Tax=Actinophytocola sp. TaxID=1872138 RepID=UPI002DDD5D05|nr:beta-L-arabinofuranosidase domain-containing protein [Actinophytocola sp.]HEV2782532.1 beta-L-arabinofuranosidase domain-containing protein [Actinophytocola sp.]